MNRSHRITFIVILIIVPVFLLALFYIDGDFWNKTSTQIWSFSRFSSCKTHAQVQDFPKPNIGPFPNDNPPSCTCQNAPPANQYVSKDELEDLQKRRAEEYRQHQIRMGKQNDVLLLAPANTPLQYPIKGFRVTPMKKTLIPGLVLQTRMRTLYKVSLSVQKGVLSVMDVQEGEHVDGQNAINLTISSSSLHQLNDLLNRVTYTSTVYHIKTEDLAYFSFENHEVIFPIVIRRPSVPVLFDSGKDINSQVTILVKAFLRYKELHVLIKSIRQFYPNIKIIIADDSHNPEKVVGDNIEHYIMPPAQGWFAGRNLAVSQVTTKYFLWVDDDFVFLNETRIESFVKILEAVPDLDVVGGEVQGNRFFFRLQYEEGSSEEGGCIKRVRGTHTPLPGFNGCFYADGVVNYFMARTDAVRKVGFDPFLKRVAHTEFFLDGLGDLLVVTCKGLRIGHQKKSSTGKYGSYRHPLKSDSRNKISHHYFKNHLKCIGY
ncbi:beta-1,4 N-acetylgalactosaminyltransferase 1-like [Myxocyprinus asiaticus]|uniref:beta-1,4 N-acetylgalactosaminyltransferase 1-like n=1 Tax=Myxocyprinus asiaticus TaxID=70543 RepID=UPI002221FB6D|nr:beta-1,4 N-acetylgalactosaminyltransferase 1-like [Myxocyprinus asiaticus]XP_051546252.1 beta-1,4 N-acetylgalactosaminyltransferase 1-like [Myxocyprinus asiaticus]